MERTIARLFVMSDEVWARHASGWSVWTRVATLPFLLLALWSHTWIGWWALFAVAAVLVWLWLNPRLFPRPRTTNTWGAKATFGERVWLNRDKVPIPSHHRVVPHVLSVVAAVGMVVAVGGALANALWPTALGAVLAYAGKLWFCDRMVWLYEDMKDADPAYRGWLY
jgi:hypothetical protein